MEFIDSLNTHFGLPTPVQHIGKIQDQIVIRSQDQLFFFDEFLNIQPAPTGIQITAIQWSRIEKPSKDILSQIQRTYVGTDITWERLILDIHAGALSRQTRPTHYGPHRDYVYRFSHDRSIHLEQEKQKKQ